MKTPSYSLPDQTTASDINKNSNDLEEMLKRIYRIAQIVANAPSPMSEVGDQDHDAVQKHSNRYLQ